MAGDDDINSRLREGDMSEKKIRHKTAEAALIESEAKFKAVFDNAAIGISISGPDRRLIDSNLALQNFLGYSPGELQGMDFSEFTYPVDAEKDVEMYGALVEGQIDHYRLEKRYIRKDGSLVWGRLTVSAMKGADGKFQFAVRMLEDISESRRMEDELRESATFLAKAQELAHIGSWSWDLRTGRLKWSDENYRIFGARPQEFPVDYATFIELVHPDDRDIVMGAITASLQGNMPIDIEYRIIGRNGEKRIIRDVGEVVFEDGEPVQIYGTLQDISERKLADEALLLAKNDAELYVDLMGHDINNMNQITMGFLELARDILRQEGSLSAENVELLDKAYESLQNSSHLIDSVRKLQRGKAGFYCMSPQDLDAIMGEVVAGFNDVQGRDISIVYAPSGRFFVSANELLKDVFMSLVGNSIKHSRGALAISISADKLVQSGKVYCKVVIEDNGPGIPDGLKKSLFDRLNLATTRARGKGFGLCLTKMLVDDYGGRFWVEDRVEGDYTKGCRFVVLLPASGQ
ncbi:MAG TPA: PAS domain S-box protein [Methanocella sp.]|nr:PAS domain S-box protein [Methanocella sp.]